MPSIYWAADSTVQFNSYRTYPQTGMGQVLSIFLKPEVLVKNHAINGRSTKSFIDQSRLAAIYDQIEEGDFLFIQFGHNDEKIDDPLRYTDPNGEYKVNLEKFVNVARNKKAYPVLISPLTRRCFTEDGKGLERGEHKPYVDALMETAKRLEVPVVDLYSMSREAILEAGSEKTKDWYMHLPKDTYFSHPEGLEDNTHLKYEGAVKFASLIAKGLMGLGGIYRELLLEDIVQYL